MVKSGDLAANEKKSGHPSGPDVAQPQASDL
jgi:hypothetical protein